MLKILKIVNAICKYQIKVCAKFNNLKFKLVMPVDVRRFRKYKRGMNGAEKGLETKNESFLY